MRMLSKAMLSLITFVLFNSLLFSSVSAATETIDIDTAQFGNEIIGHYGSGFMLTFPPSVQPDYLTKDLNIKFYKVQSPEITTNYSIAKDLGSQVDFLIYSDYFAAHHSLDEWPGDGGDWTEWEESVTDAVNLALTNNYDVEYEIWNEPNAEFFWGSDQASFFEAWKRAYIIIRTLDPSASITGPSIYNYDLAYLQAFLTYAKTNNVLPNTLTWHELDLEDGYSLISTRVNEISSWMSANNIDVDRIVINEFINPGKMYSPQTLQGFFTEFERNKIYGVHACWDDTQQGENNCFNKTLEGILTKDYQPRSLWWIYKYYADMQGNLKFVDGSIFSGFSTFDTANKKVQILLGQDQSGTNSFSMNYKSSWLDNLNDANSKKITVSVYTISENTGAAVSSISPTTYTLNYTNGGILLNTVSVSNDAVVYMVIQDESTEPTLLTTLPKTAISDSNFPSIFYGIDIIILGIWIYMFNGGEKIWRLIKR